MHSPTTATVVLGQPLATHEPWTYLGMSRSNWNKLRSQRRTPAPISLSAGRPSWRISDLQSWLDSLPAIEQRTKRGGNRRKVSEGERDAV
jgi:predicted DNA-binding transcriptional regulator AlpA